MRPQMSSVKAKVPSSKSKWRLGRSSRAPRMWKIRCSSSGTEPSRAYSSDAVLRQFALVPEACAKPVVDSQPASSQAPTTHRSRNRTSTLVTYEALPGIARITPVRSLSSTILVLLAALSASADVIHLKNGRTIWADQVRQTKDRVEYDVGDDSYAIPKAAVDRVDAGGVAPARAQTAAADVSDFTPPAPTFDHEADVATKVVRDGKV